MCGCLRLCYRKWLILFSLKLQRDNRKNALAVDPAEGKTGKRLYFSPDCGDETTTYYNRALFNCCNIMKIQVFSVLLRGSMVGDITAEKVSFWLFFLLCYRKWLMLFSLKLQRDNRQNALTVDPAKGKTGEKGCIFTVLWR